MHKFHIVGVTLLFLFFPLSWSQEGTAFGDSSQRVVVLVPGIVFDEKSPTEVQQTQINCWKGVIHSMQEIAECRLHTVEFEGPKVSIRPMTDRTNGFAVYTIVFSAEAAVDSLVYRAIELDTALKEICHREDSKISLVAYSAGGLVSRIVVQEAIPGVACPRQLDHVVTIATPHQGAALADNFSGNRGARFTSLQTTEPLIRKLNALSLPKSIHFTTFILSSFGLESGKPGLAYTLPEFGIADGMTIPEHYLLGGDGAVHSISQNLIFTATGATRSTELPVGISTVMVRMPVTDEKLSSTLHTTALRSSQLCNKISKCALRMTDTQDYRRWQAECLVQCRVEEIIRARKTFYIKLNQVSDINIDEMTLKDSVIHYRATGSWIRTGPSREEFSGEIPVQNSSTFGLMMAK